MKLATVNLKGKEMTAIVEGEVCIPIHHLTRNQPVLFPGTLSSLLKEEKWPLLQSLYEKGKMVQKAGKDIIRREEVRFSPPYSDPEKIWGIGLNYAEHAKDLKAVQPEQFPVGFNKPPTTIIGPLEPIVVPEWAGRCTCEAELGLIIGRTARHILPERWKDYVAGYVPVIDVTSLEILQQNPRYLTLSKSFDTFFSFGPEMHTLDEIEDVASLTVQTWHNHKLAASNTVDKMRFSPGYLVAFLSTVFTLKPGDIISTGTPGAVEVGDGDIVEARITGFPPLKNNIKIRCDGSAIKR